MLGKGLQLKSITLLVFFLWLVKSLKNFYIIGLSITQTNAAFFYFQYGFRTSESTTDLLRVVSDRIVRAFNKPRATGAVALDISRAFEKVGSLFHKLKSFFGTTLFLPYINDLPDDAICNIAIYNDTILYSNCDEASALWQQIESASELESDLRDTVAGAGSGLLISNTTGVIDVKMHGSVSRGKIIFYDAGVNFLF